MLSQQTNYPTPSPLICPIVWAYTVYRVLSQCANDIRNAQIDQPKLCENPAFIKPINGDSDKSMGNLAYNVRTKLREGQDASTAMMGCGQRPGERAGKQWLSENTSWLLLHLGPPSVYTDHTCKTRVPCTGTMTPSLRQQIWSAFRQANHWPLDWHASSALSILRNS